MPINEAPMPFRQIHLDFHTSPDIAGVGASFDADEFADTLAAAHVDSVTVFARCHHGYLYYATGRHPERVHPSLVRPNLLLEQIEACHRRGIRTPIYTTVEWDLYTAERQRDWLLLDPEGREVGSRPLEAGFYRYLDVLHPGYRQFLFDHVADIFDCVPVDGLFFDICIPQPSVARHWIDAMDAAGLDPAVPAQRKEYSRRVMDEWQQEMSAFVRARAGANPCTIFYNSGHVGPRHLASRAHYTHFELESLPSGWGYLHFPVAQRFARTMGKPTLGMTGKFHTSWGDFQSYKNPAALQYECFRMLALGARCSIGDQLPPDGRLDATTYKLIGGVYGDVATKEPWCADARPLSDIAVFTPEEFALRRQTADDTEHHMLPSAMGAVRMLEEMQHQFDVVTSATDLSAYKLAILPDDIPVDEEFAARLEAFAAAGGAIIASHRSGLAPTGERFASPLFGVVRVGDAPYQPDFVRPTPKFAEQAGLEATSYVMYQRAMQVAAMDGAETPAQVERPHFNRTWRRFCSHQHAPSSGEVCYPGVVQQGSVIYFAHPVFGQYNANAPLWCKALVRAAIARLLPEPLLRVSGPSSLLAALNEQPSRSRLTLHLLHYIPERRGQAFDVIEDVLPVHDVGIDLAVSEPVGGVCLVPDGAHLPFMQDAGRVRFRVPELNGHALVEIALEPRP